MLLRFARFVVPAMGLVLYAQDASLVLRTSVGYRTQRNSMQLSDEQKKMADQLNAEANQANAAGKYGDAMRALYHGMAVMRGVPWTPAYECAAGLQARVDHAVPEPGTQITVTLTPLYPCQESAKLTGTGVLKQGTNETALGSRPLDVSKPISARLPVPASVTGNFVIEIRLTADGEEAPAAARAAMVKPLSMHAEALSESAQKLRDRIAKSTKKSPALATAAYGLELYERADRGEVNPAAVHFTEEFAKANEILDAIDAGRDPFAGKKGDFHKAYRSAVDNTLQPYRVFVPAAYDAAKPSGLVIALHGMGGDENSMFDSYAGAMKREAERTGLVVACPKGRDTASMYRGSAEQDVLDVLTEVRRDYNIDANRIYMMGHSMGGYGTWSTAMDHPDLFAALGPISGGGNTAGMAKIAHIPEYVVHGDTDATVPVTQSRTMVEAGKKAGASITYVEIPGGSHVSVAAPQFGPMLDFFVKQRKGAAEATRQ